MLTAEAIKDVAAKATKEHLEKFGETYPCGFAWVQVKLMFKGNTTLGREERSRLKSLGFDKSYTSNKVMELWNPSKNSTQSMLAKEAGAKAAAKLLNDNGYIAFAYTRLD